MPEFASRPLVLPPYKGEIAESYASPEFPAILADPRALMRAPGTEILLDGRNTVAALKMTAARGSAGTEIVIKQYRGQGIPKLKSLVQASKAARAWRGAMALIAAGFATPLPLAYLERRKRGFVQDSFFLAERIRDAQEIRLLFRERSEEGLKPLLSDLAAQLCRMHEKGILQRDLSDGNILVKQEGGGIRFYLLDTNRIRVRTKISGAARARNLIRLGIPARLRHFFLEQYAAAAGRPLRRSFEFWYKLNKSTFAGWIAVKKKLRLKRLAKKLKIQ
jgi:hypothetical protein